MINRAYINARRTTWQTVAVHRGRRNLPAQVISEDDAPDVLLLYGFQRGPSGLEYVGSYEYAGDVLRMHKLRGARRRLVGHVVVYDYVCIVLFVSIQPGNRALGHVVSLQHELYVPWLHAFQSRPQFMGYVAGHGYVDDVRSRAC